jgi:hypothetical protein
MNIKGDLLRIQSADYDLETGHKIELEEKPAERVLITDAQITGQLDQQNHGSIRASVVLGGNVQQFAEGMRTMCATCKHVDHAAWTAYRRKMASSADGRALLLEMLSALDATGNAKVEWDKLSVEAEQALLYMGICHPMTEIKNDPIIVHPESTCPPELCSDMQPHGLHEPVSSDADKAGSAAFDLIMRRAAGQN